MSVRAAASTTIEVDDSAGNYHQSGGGGAGLLKPSGGHSSRLDLRNLLGRPGGGPSLKGASVSAPSTPVEDVVSSGATTGVANTHHLYVAPPKYGIKKRGSSSGPGMSEGVLKELIHPAHADALKAHSTLTLKLLKTVSDFTQQLSAIEEQHGEQLQQLVETFRKRNAELRKERPNGSYGLFQVWETLLQEVEVDSAVVHDISTCLSRQVSRPMIEGTFHRKIEARKIFQHREALEQALEKASQQLDKSYQLYDKAYQEHIFAPNTLTLAAYVQLHNNYVQDVRAANAMAEQYSNVILPQLVQELESVYVDLSKTMTTTIQHGCEAMSERSEGMSKRYNALAAQCRTVNPLMDLNTFVRSVLGGGSSNNSGGTVHKFAFIPPAIVGGNAGGPSPNDQDASLVLKDELIFDRLAGFSLRTKFEALKKDVVDVESHVRQLNDCLDSLNRMQQRSLDSNLYNKANELQEEICAKKLDLRLAQLHLAALRAQRDLYGSKAEMLMAETAGSSQQQQKGSRMSLISSGGAASTGGNNAGTSGGGMKTKWMKAIRTLTTSSNNNNNGTSGSATSCSTPNGGIGCLTLPPLSSSSVQDSSAMSSSAQSAHVRELEKGSRLYQAVMAVIAIRKTPSTSESSSSKNNGGKSEKQRHLHLASSSSDLLAFQQAAGVASAFMEGANNQKHIFQENTYKKITPCDVCSQVLRGHSRQGWKCRLCKINVHGDCRNGVGRCLPKSRLLRRQKSGSELVTTATNPSSGSTYDLSNVVQSATNGGMTYEMDDGQSIPLDVNQQDPTYVVLKQAGEMANSNSSSSGNVSSNRRRPPPPLEVVPLLPSSADPAGSSLDVASNSGSTGAINRPSRSIGIGRRANPNTLSVGDPSSFQPSSSAPHSPRRHQKLNLRMKSFSLDESGEHFQSGNCGTGQGGGRGSIPGTSSSGGGRHHSHHGGYHSGGRHPQQRSGSNPSCNTSAQHSQGSSYSQSPSSPVQPPMLLQNRRLLSVRMNSVELPDENEKSQSSNSASPCPSPKTQRLLPTNLYVVLFNFKGREADELDLKAGYKVTVIDASDPDWWRGKCLGKVGFFPSKYVTKLAPNEKPLQVTHNLQLSDDADDGALHKVLRDQIVIQIGEEVNGMITVRSGDNKQGACPSQFLQEV